MSQPRHCQERTMTQSSPRRANQFINLGHFVAMGAIVVAIGAVMSIPRSSANAAREIPAPALESSHGNGATTEVAVLSGGCFWGVQGVYQHVKGVSNAVSGYAGGEEKTAHYEVVSRGMTGHAEAVQVTFDPRQISYGRILQIFFSVAHDP